MATLTATDHGTTFHGIWADGRSHELKLALPGRFNHANALMAAVAAEVQGIAIDDGLAAMATISDVAGRFTVHEVGGVRTRLMLAKNPAGWSELLDLVGQDHGPVVISINARTADGADPSWLWDVPFERLANRVVVATGDRCRDLAVRLHYAGVSHQMEEDPVAAVKIAGEGPDGPDGARVVDVADVADVTDVAGRAAGYAVDAIGNYTAFNDLLGVKA
jgi:UDP-N-acetylmuramyl tripeptide synthase